MSTNPGRALTPILVTLLTVSAMVPRPSSAQGYTGTYRVDYMGDALTLVLATAPDGAVRGRLFGRGVDLAALGSETMDDFGQSMIQGALSAPGGPGGLFEFSVAQGGEFGFLLIPNDGAGVPQRSEAQLSYATRLSETVPRSMLPPGHTPSRPDGSSAGAGDARALVGTWRTRVEPGESGAPRATEVLMELRADGVMVDLGTRAAGAGRGSALEGGGEETAWRARGSVLEVSSAGSPWVPLARYEIKGARELVLIFPRNGTRQTWSRVN